MARYIPKSKVNILQATGNEFIIASTGQPFQGTYMELSDGTFFSGNNPQNPGELLIRKRSANLNMPSSGNNRKYRKLRKDIYAGLSSKSDIPINKVPPLEFKKAAIVFKVLSSIYFSFFIK